MLVAQSVDGRIEVMEVPMPEPGPQEALIKVSCVGICETDVHITLHPGSSGGRPMIMGHEWSGVVEKAPAGSGLLPGSRVVGEGMVGCARCSMCRAGRINLCADYREIGFTLPGAYAQYLSIPAANLHPIPDRMSMEEAAMVEPTAVALHAIDLSGMEGGDSVAVLGPGPIGLLAAQLALGLGAGKLVLTGTREERLALARELGIHNTINTRDADPVEAVLALIDGGARIVLDAAGTAKSFTQALAMAGKGATIVLVGGWNEVTWTPGTLIGRELTLRGSLASPGAWERSIEMISRGDVSVSPLITHRFPLEEIPRAFDLVDRRADGLVKAVVMPNS